MGNKVENAEAKLHDQSNYLNFRDLMIVFSIMSTSLLVCFIDQNGIGVLLPSIAKDLNAQSVSTCSKTIFCVTWLTSLASQSLGLGRRL